jgi:hypothetical protein
VDKLGAHLGFGAMMNAAGPFWAAAKLVEVGRLLKSPADGPSRKFIELSRPPKEPLPLLTVTVSAWSSGVVPKETSAPHLAKAKKTACGLQRRIIRFIIGAVASAGPASWSVFGHPQFLFRVRHCPIGE